MYDVFLYAPCKINPNFNTLDQHHACLKRPNFARQCMKLERQRFLGFVLNKEDAIALLQCLQKAGGKGTVARSAYKHFKITPGEAEYFAKQALAEIKAQIYPTYSFGPLFFHRETATTWLFRTSSPQFLRDGYNRDTLYIAVDKLNGHIWQEEELKRDIHLA